MKKIFKKFFSKDRINLISEDLSSKDLYVLEIGIHKGDFSKQLAHNLMRAIIVDFTEGEDEKVLLQLLEDNTIDNMIDLIVDATKGKLDINNVANVSVGCFTRCMPYLC